jgi:phage shock protein PspC (stress-responsive transcriptional regulator)
VALAGIRDTALTAPRNRGRLLSVQRVSIHRARKGRVFGGVARGIANKFAIDPLYVRLAFVLLTLASGVGVFLYVAGLALMPDEKGSLSRVGKSLDSDSDVTQGLAFGAIVLGTALLLRRVGVWFPARLLWPGVFIFTGLAMVWRRNADDPKTSGGDFHSFTEALKSAKGPQQIWHVITVHWTGSTKSTSARVVAGGLLVLSGSGALFASGQPLQAVRNALVPAFLLLVGLAVIAGPWLLRLNNDLSEERNARIRSEERADIAAHLHDSVLQTLAIIQRRADQPKEIVTLARRQERELRAWLYDGTQVRGEGQARSIGEAIEAVADDVERDFGVRVDVVKVGDCPVDQRSEALVAAAREAMVNAAKHSGVEDISVYFEASADEIELFVRDRGAGFDVETIAADRRGLRDSIRGRVEKLGGEVSVHSEIGVGTEVQFRFDRAAVERSAVERSAVDRSAADRSAADRSAVDRSAVMNNVVANQKEAL